MATESSGDADSRRVRQGVHDEVLIWRIDEHAGLEHERRTGSLREVALRKAPQDPLVFSSRRAVRVVGIDRLPQVVELSELETGDVVDREAVEAPLVDVENEYRKRLRREQLGSHRLQPGEHLALGNRQLLEGWDERASPGSGADHQTIRLLRAGLGFDF